MVKSKNRAKEVMFWPGMNSQIENAVSNCPACTEHQSSNPKEPMTAHKLPDRPWQNVATDLFELHNEQYMIVVDYCSRYFELERMPNTPSAALINKMKSIFSRHGIAEEVVSDNGPQFPAHALYSPPGATTSDHALFILILPEKEWRKNRALKDITIIREIES